MTSRFGLALWRSEGQERVRLIDHARPVQSLKGSPAVRGRLYFYKDPPHGIHRSEPIVFRVRPVLGRQEKKQRRAAM